MIAEKLMADLKDMIKQILREVFLFWLRHPWRVFWSTFAGTIVISLLLDTLGVPSFDLTWRTLLVASLAILAISFVFGLRASWKRSLTKAIAMLAVWAVIPVLGMHGGIVLLTTTGGIVFLSCWILVPVVLAAATEYATSYLTTVTT
jgi:hypothetical protein